MIIIPNSYIASGEYRYIQPDVQFLSISTTGSVTTQIDTVLLDLYRNNISIENMTEIRKFLLNHTNLIKALYNIPLLLTKSFPNATFSLETYYDQEDENNSVELLLKITTPQDVITVMSNIKQLNKNWLFPIGKDGANFHIVSDYL